MTDGTQHEDDRPAENEAVDKPMTAAPVPDMPASDGDAGDWWWKLLAVGATLCLLVPLFILLKPAAITNARAAHAIKHGFVQLDNEEGALLYQARELAAGRSIYRSLEDPPWVAGTYTPVFMWLAGMFDSGGMAGFATGRTIVYASVFLLCVLMVVMVTSATRNVVAGMLPALLLLATMEAYNWIGYFRVDFPALAFSVLGLSIVVLGRGNRVGLAAAAFFMAVAIFTKQTMVAAPVACVLALLWQDWRRGLTLMGWLLAWGGVGALGLGIATGGQFFVHTILYNANTWHWNDVLIWCRHIWNVHRWMVMAAMVALAWWMLWGAALRRGEAGRRVVWIELFWLPIVLYGVIAQWSVLGIGKAGSAENYLLELIAGWGLLIGLTLGGLMRSMGLGEGGRAMKALMTVVVVAVGGMTLMHAVVMGRDGVQEILMSPYKNATRADFEAAEHIRERMNKVDTAFAELAVYHLQIDEKPVFQPFIMSELARQGRWDETRFVEMIDNKEFGLVVALDDLTAVPASARYTPAMLRAFKRAYRMDELVRTPLWTFYLLVPRDADKEAREVPEGDYVQNGGDGVEVFS